MPGNQSNVTLLIFLFQYLNVWSKPILHMPHVPQEAATQRDTEWNIFVTCIPYGAEMHKIVRAL